MEKKYLPLSEGIQRLGGDAEAFAQAFELGEAPLFLYARLRDFPMLEIGAYIWMREKEFQKPTFSGTWTWPDFANSLETRIEAEDDIGKRIATFCTGYFIVHPSCVRAALAGVDVLTGGDESIYLLPPRTLELNAYRSDMMRSDWLLTRVDMARRGSFDGFFLSTLELGALLEMQPVKPTPPPIQSEADQVTEYSDAPNLEAAIAAYRAVKADPSLAEGRTIKQAIRLWAKKNRPDLSETALDSIAAVANWDTAGGAPATPPAASE